MSAKSGFGRELPKMEEPATKMTPSDMTDCHTCHTIYYYTPFTS